MRDETKGIGATGSQVVDIRIADYQDNRGQMTDHRHKTTDPASPPFLLPKEARGLRRGKQRTDDWLIS